jgi:dTDP-4-dehydrorhamnose 3,5-epimerase
MQVIPTEIPDVKVVVPQRFGDNRGFFSEVYSRSKMAAAGIEGEFVQDNHSLSAERGVVRGLHYQVDPMAQGELVRVVRGSILDVAVDVRVGSPTFGRHVTAVISAENWRQIYVPAGFAHGFVTLEPATEVIYKVTNYYSPQHERGIRWDDPALGIAWGVSPEAAVLSARDREHPPLSAAKDLFKYRG